MCQQGQEQRMRDDITIYTRLKPVEKELEAREEFVGKSGFSTIIRLKKIRLKKIRLKKSSCEGGVIGLGHLD